MTTHHDQLEFLIGELRENASITRTTLLQLRDACNVAAQLAHDADVQLVLIEQEKSGLKND